MQYQFRDGLLTDFKLFLTIYRSGLDLVGNHSAGGISESVQST